MDRPAQYSKAVQSTTYCKQFDCIRAYLGYVHRYENVSLAALSIENYHNPQHIANFLGYLLARTVGGAHTIKHVSLARKINSYLARSTSAASSRSATGQNAAQMDAWLHTLENQITQVTPKPDKSNLPSAEAVFAWVHEVVKSALETAEFEVMNGGLTPAGARQVQDAVILGIGIGVEAPPCRLSIVKSAVHPKYHGKVRCPDKDCRHPDTCGGNTWKVTSAEEDADGAEIQLVAPHHKNDARGFESIMYTYAKGSVFAKLFFLHIDKGHQLLTSMHTRGTQVGGLTLINLSD